MNIMEKYSPENNYSMKNNTAYRNNTIEGAFKVLIVDKMFPKLNNV